MRTSSIYKPIGGVESVALYPADAVRVALFSSEGCEVEFSGSPIEVALVEDASQYEESTSVERGVTAITHRLQLVAERNDATAWLDNQFIECATYDGLVAVVSLGDGRNMLAGYSAKFGNEQPLRLTSLTSSSGNSPHQTPSVTLLLVSHDTDFSPLIL